MATNAKPKKAAKAAAKPTPKPALKPAAGAAKANPKPAASAKPAAKEAAQPPAKAAAKPTEAPPPARKPKSEVATKLLHLIAEEMAIEEAELTANASFREDLNLDEIDIAELLMQAERAFNLPPFEDEEWEGLETVGDLEALVEGRVAAKRGRKPAR